jgi:hypothetical protein
LISIGYCLAGAPASWVIIGETSAIRLRPLSTGFSRGMYYVTNIPCIFLSSYMLNPTGGNRKSLVSFPMWSKIKLNLVYQSAENAVSFGVEPLLLLQSPPISVYPR